MPRARSDRTTADIFTPTPRIVHRLPRRDHHGLLADLNALDEVLNVGTTNVGVIHDEAPPLANEIAPIRKHEITTRHDSPKSLGALGRAHDIREACEHAGVEDLCSESSPHACLGSRAEGLPAVVIAIRVLAVGNLLAGCLELIARSASTAPNDAREHAGLGGGSPRSPCWVSLGAGPG